MRLLVFFILFSIFCGCDVSQGSHRNYIISQSPVTTETLQELPNEEVTP